MLVVSNNAGKPLKTNTDTQNDGLEDVTPSKNSHLSMINFKGATPYIPPIVKGWTISLPSPWNLPRVPYLKCHPITLYTRA